MGMRCMYTWLPNAGHSERLHAFPTLSAASSKKSSEHTVPCGLLNCCHYNKKLKVTVPAKPHTHQGNQGQGRGLCSGPGSNPTARMKFHVTTESMKWAVICAFLSFTDKVHAVRCSTNTHHHA